MKAKEQENDKGFENYHLKVSETVLLKYFLRRLYKVVRLKKQEKQIDNETYNIVYRLFNTFISKENTTNSFTPNSLESGLVDTLATMQNTKYKVIFVLDEFDTIEEIDVIRGIKSLKSFLSQASALFVVITGEEFYEKVMQSAEDPMKVDSLFSKRIFLQRPQFEEMEEVYRQYC